MLHSINFDKSILACAKSNLFGILHCVRAMQLVDAVDKWLGVVRRGVLVVENKIQAGLVQNL